MTTAKPSTPSKERHLVDHVGADLWRAFRAYEKAMFARVSESGFDDISLADSDILVLLEPEGIHLTELARRRRVTKQAAHEQVHSLVKRGYLALETDPDDRRARIVGYTRKGLNLTKALVDIKRQLHRKVADAIGADELRSLRQMLAVVEEKLG